MEKTKGDELYELKKKIQALEWDIKYNHLPKERVNYYNLLLEKYNEMRDTEISLNTEKKPLNE